jgi:hypothetical protein
MSYGQNLERITVTGAGGRSGHNLLSDIRIIVREGASQGYMNITRLCKTARNGDSCRGPGGMAGSIDAGAIIPGVGLRASAVRYCRR